MVTYVHSENKHKSEPNLVLLAATAYLLVVTAVLFITVNAQSHENAAASVRGGTAVIRSTCAATFYPELCFSTVSTATGDIRSRKDVLMAALNYTVLAAETNYFTVRKIYAAASRDKGALHDCMEMIDDTLDELKESEMEIKDYGCENYSLADHKENLMTLLSAAQTNQESCLDGLSHGGPGHRALLGGGMHVFRLVSNVLAIIKNLSDTEETAKNSYSSHVTGDEREWPKWLSARDRRLLLATSVTPNVTVAADGSGDHRTVSEAVAAAPEGGTGRYVIRIKSGVYRENVEIPKKKTNLMFVGDGRMRTIITGDRNVEDGNTTFNSATVAVVGTGFLARDITFENTAGPSKHQAVALRVNADLTAFYRCNMLAYQDTLYVHSLRQFYTACTVVGTVDFIFGNAAVVLQNCDIRPRLPNPGQRNMITAQGRADPNQNTGIVIQRCRIRANPDLRPVQSEFPTYLGRPWKEYSRTVVMQTKISNVIDPAGWHEWDGDFALDTLFYAEYRNRGAGGGTEKRVGWKGFRVLKSEEEARPFTAERFICGGSWLADTGFPFSLGL